MALQLGDTAPDFTAETTEGPLSFHQWLGDSWGVLFSHPKDFTPVCTTELGHRAQLGGAHGREVLGMREEDAPRIAQPLVEADRAFGRLCGEVGGCLLYTSPSPRD